TGAARDAVGEAARSSRRPAARRAGGAARRARPAGPGRRARAGDAGGVRRGALLPGRRGGEQARAGRDAGTRRRAHRHHREGAARAARRASVNLRASVNQRAGVRRAVRAVALAAVLLAIGQGRARADRVDEAWRRGNEAYLHGDYAGAVAAYQEVNRQGPASADVAFNLGDAYFHKGALGPSIWAFERALALDP